MLERIEARLREGALHIHDILAAEGFRTYFAGGAVRDLLLNRRFNEIDIATAAPPDVVERLFPRTVGVGREFGVVVAVVGGTSYEIATFRAESGYTDGRHPEHVRFTHARQDALRRDFTVNALFLDPVTGKVIDYTNGRKDLDRGLIRTVRDPLLTFGEDKLRVLRAIRFACQLGFRIDGPTYDGVTRYAYRLSQISRERIRDELLKILCGPAPARGLSLLSDSGVLEEVLPEVFDMHGVMQPPAFHPEGDVFQHTRLMFSLGGNLSPALALAVLLHDVGKPGTFAFGERIRFDGHAELGARMAGDICRRLKLSGARIQRVVGLVKDHLRFMHVQQMRESTLRRFLRTEGFEEHLELHRLDCLASHGDLSNYDFCREKLSELDREALAPPPLINGHDLIALGLKPGPLFSEILKQAEDLQLEGILTARDDALSWVRKTHGT
ncbi:MAG: CCA tRNA nucleotidyltransferase [Candidatus Aminicenantes bacterium]|nr:CCA tRNA nucleotidyltransferase [Candidatus Aminicenantes bacterium]